MIKRPSNSFVLLSLKVSRSGKAILPMPEKANRIPVDKQCETAFKELKGLLAMPHVLSKLEPEEELSLYLSVMDNTLSVVLVQEEDKSQRPIYFASKTFQGAKIRYQKIEKLALALMMAARKLRLYF